MKVLVTGVNGQVGWELARRVPAGVTLDATDRAVLDLATDDVAARVIARRPEVIVNVAAYTAVDRAESESALAHRVNADGAGALARAARELGARLVHVSTDFVFDGSASRPYAPGAEKGLRFDDPAIGIKFPIEPVIVSAKDRSWPDFER